MERLIFHIDVNSAFLSWEAARRVALLCNWGMVVHTGMCYLKMRCAAA